MTKIPFLDLKAQHEPIKNELQKVFDDVFHSNGFVLSQYVEEFENEFASYLGASHCVGLNSGTDALLLALKALDIGPGDEVITVANTFYATVEAIILSGATPVFVDADAASALMDQSQIESKITKNTKAIIPVHLYGQPCSMDPILEVAKKHQLYVIEDACQAHGAVYKGKKAGTLGDIGCFSFYPGKNLGALGDGGALVTNNKEWAVKVKMFRNHGGVNKYQHDLLGYNSRLDGMQAGFLKVKLRYLDEWNQQRNKIAAIYNSCIAQMPSVEAFKVLDQRTAVYHLYVIKVETSKRDSIIQQLQEKGVQCGIHYPEPVHLLKPVKKYLKNQAAYPVAEKLCASIISLPMYPKLSEGMVQDVMKSLQSSLK